MMTSKLLLFALCAAFVHARPANPEDKADGYVVYDYTIEIPSDASLSQGWYLVGQTLQGPKTFIFNDFGWKEAGGDEQHGGYFEMLYEEPSKTLTVVVSLVCRFLSWNLAVTSE